MRWPYRWPPHFTKATKMKYLLPLIICTGLLSSCHKPIHAEKGAIDVLSNVYLNASKGLNQIKSYHVSTLNYSHDTILELIPNQEIGQITEEAYFIQDTTFLTINNPEYVNRISIEELKSGQNPKSIFQKQTGSVFTHEHLPNYAYRHDISDTILFGKTYKRFEIKSPENYARYYVHPTDTILPYTIYGEVYKQYKGRIERIDSYNKESDIFITLQLLPRADWDESAKEFFSYNHYLNTQRNAK